MNREELQALWNHVIELDSNIGLDSRTISDVQSKLKKYAKEHGINIEELEIEY